VDEEDFLTAKNAKNANGPGASKVPNDAFDLQAWRAEIQQQAKMQAGCLEVVQALGAMDIVQCPASLSVILCAGHNRREGAYYAEQGEESSA
jgi:hypothetical protein